MRFMTFASILLVGVSAAGCYLGGAAIIPEAPLMTMSGDIGPGADIPRDQRVVIFTTMSG